MKEDDEEEGYLGGAAAVPQDMAGHEEGAKECQEPHPRLVRRGQGLFIVRFLRTIRSQKLIQGLPADQSNANGHKNLKRRKGQLTSFKINVDRYI